MPNIAASRVAPAVRWTLFDSPEPFAATLICEPDGSWVGAINTAAVAREAGAAVGAWASQQLAGDNQRAVMPADELPAVQCVKVAS